MVLVEFAFDKDLIKSFEISGHAKFRKKGKDILCAAVSSLSIHTVNILDELGYKNNLIEKEGYMKFELLETDEKAQIILKVLYESFNQLKTQYKSYLKIEVIK